MQGSGQRCRNKDFCFLPWVMAVLLTHLAVFAAARTFLDFNIKSRAVSDWLAKNGIHNTTLESPDSLRHALDDMIRLDFSGHIQSWLVGPARVGFEEGSEGLTVEDPTRKVEPLFGIRRKRYTALLPDVFIGCRYDFERTKYGATSVDAAFRWNVVRNEGAMSPSMMELRTMTGLVSGSWQSTEFALQWDRLGQLPVLVKAERTPILKQVSCKLPLHRRLDYELRIKSTLSTIQGARNANINQERHREWWLPHIVIGSSGVLESLNTAAVPHPLSRKGRKDRGLGIRFRVRHRLQWSPFSIGAASDDEDEGTSFMLELEELGAHEASALHVQLHSFLERPLDNIRLSILQQITPKFFIR